MTQFQFPDDPATTHVAQRAGGQIRVDGTAVPLRVQSAGTCVTEVDGRPVRVHVVAHGDTVHLHMRGRAWRIDRVDPARAGTGGGGKGAGDAIAPMPGVVVTRIASPGMAVEEGAPLMVIESMKLQMTVAAGRAGTVESLPFEEGQTFQRGALLARIRAAEDGQ